MLRVVGLLLALGVLASAAPLGTSPRPRLLHRFAERNLMRATAQTRRHNGVFVNGPHQNIANDCSDAIAAALSPGSAFNTYVSGYKILAGTDEVWTSKHVMAFAGTAAEVMGCRAAPGNDLDFWSTAANIRRLGTVLYRFELAAAKDNIWVAREGINPGEPADATHLGTFLNYREMDVWSIKANRMSQDVYGRIRDRIHKGGNVDSMLLDVHGNKIRVMDCANQIRAKWSLVTDGHRHAKHVTGHPNDHTPGRRKLTNDALDLQCLCHHKKCKDAVQSLDHENDDVKQICDYDWQAVSTAAADPTWTQANYNQLAGTLAANGYKSIHTRPNAPQALRTAMAGVEALKVK